MLKEDIFDAVEGLAIGVLATFVLLFSFQSNIPYPETMVKTFEHPWMLAILFILAILVGRVSPKICVLLILLLTAFVAEIYLFTRPEISNQSKIIPILAEKDSEQASASSPDQASASDQVPEPNTEDSLESTSASTSASTTYVSKSFSCTSHTHNNTNNKFKNGAAGLAGASVEVVNSPIPIKTYYMNLEKDAANIHSDVYESPTPVEIISGQTISNAYANDDFTQEHKGYPLNALLLPVQIYPLYDTVNSTSNGLIESASTN